MAKYFLLSFDDGTIWDGRLVEPEAWPEKQAVKEGVTEA